MPSQQVLTGVEDQAWRQYTACTSEVDPIGLAYLCKPLQTRNKCMNLATLQHIIMITQTSTIPFDPSNDLHGLLTSIKGLAS